ncbi:MAG: SURF1 family protein [Cytophaga sp.]|nr:SURF1 family protein [Undibacterium sp.]
MLNSFRFRRIPLLSTLILCLLGVVLGQWQTRRAEEKENIVSALLQRSQMPSLTSNDLNRSPKDIIYRQVRLSGAFVSNWPLYLDNRPKDGVAGFYVLMPFKIQGTDRHVMVVRGWQPRNPANRTLMVPLKTPPDVLQLEGVIREGVDKVMQLGLNAQLKPRAILQNLDLPDVARQTSLAMPNFVINQTNETFDGLQRNWTLPIAGAEKHRAYAFQWYALSLMAVIFFVVTGFRRGKNE